MILYRPVGINELALIHDAGLRGYPPRLPDQPIFYPVLNRGYAEQIARDWNSRHGDMCGYVTRFRVDDAYVARFEPRVVGRREHEELWVPAEELEEFNGHIAPPIETIDGFFGAGFRGIVPAEGLLAGLDATGQFGTLAGLLRDGRDALGRAVASEGRTIFPHILFWESVDPSEVGIAPDERDRLVAAIRELWPHQDRLPRREAA